MKMTLKVMPVSGVMVADYAASAANIIRYIGWDFDPSLGDGETTKGGWVRVDKPVEIVCDRLLFAEYARILREGDLKPADEATAKLVGLPWSAPKKSAPESK